jgi:hypothetical protein
MARQAAMFSDQPERAAIRATRREAQFAFPRAPRNRIMIAGDLRPEPGAPFEGGQWIVEADSREAVMRLVEQDPYLDAAIRRAAIANWGRPFPEPVTL